MLGQSSQIVLAAAMMASTAIAAAPAAYAQAAPDAAQQFNIPAGDLTGALQAFSARTGMQLGYSAELTSGKRSPGVSGNMSPREALGLLLGGTGLSAQISGNSATLIAMGAGGSVTAAEGERLLGPVRIEGEQGGPYRSPVRGEGIAQLGGIRGGQDQEEEGLRPKVSSVTTGTPVAIEDVPRSIAVVTSEQIAKQDITDLPEALTRTPGVTVVGGGTNVQYFSRGYEIQKYTVDGGPPRNLRDGAGSYFEGSPGSVINLDAYERVEVVQGVNAMFVGEGSLGGSINLIRKRPGAQKALLATAELGNLRRAGLSIDYSTPSLFGTPIAFRGVVSARRDGGFVDDYDMRNFLVSGIFDAPLGESARIEAGFTWTKLEENGLYLGAPRFIDGDLIPLPRSFNNTGFADPFQRKESLEIFSKLFVDVAEDWDFEFGLNHISESYRARGATVSALFDSDGFVVGGGGFAIVRGRNPEHPTVLGIDAKLTGRFHTFGIEHNVFASLAHSQRERGRTSNDFVLALGPITTLEEFLNPTATALDFPATQSLYGGERAASSSIVIGDTFLWRDMIGGAITVRGDYFDTSEGRFDLSPFDNVSFLQGGARTGQKTWRPAFSALVKPIKNLTFTASYADGFTRNDNLFSSSGEGPDRTFSELKPSKYQNKEVGVRFAKDKLLTVVTLFELRETNTPVSTNIFTCPPVLNPVDGSFASACFEQGGATKTSRGVDASVTGEILPGLSIAASASYTKLKTTGVSDSELTNFKSITPQFAAALFADWRPSFLPAASLQIGARYKSRYFETGTVVDFDEMGNVCPECVRPYTMRQKAYLLLDAGVEYQLSEKLSLKLYAENITDQKYLTSYLPASQGNFYGRPRSFLATLRWRDMGAAPADGRSPTTGLAPFGRPADWYAAFDAGYAAIGDLQATADGRAADGSKVRWTFETKDKPAFSVRLGKYFGDHLRAELDLQNRNASFGAIGGGDTAPSGVCSIGGTTDNNAPLDCSRADAAKTKSWALMANAIYDFGAKDAIFRPFAGAGIGVARNSTSFQGKLRGIGPDTNFFIIDEFGFPNIDNERRRRETIVSEDRSAAFAWQAIAGGSLKITDRLRIDAAYRFVNMPSMKFGSFNLDEATPTLGTFTNHYKAHFGSLGIRWSFGRGD